MTDTLLLWNSSPRRIHHRARATRWREGDARFRQGPAKKPIGTRCHRLLEGGTRRLVQGHPSAGVLYAGRCFLGMEEFLAMRCPCCGATDADTRYARLCHRSGAYVNQHQPLVHTLSRSLKRWQSTTRWKAELRLTATGISEWTSSSRGEVSPMLWHRSIEIKRYFST